VHIADTTTILDRERLREITMDDPDLMREILQALIQDTSAQWGKLAEAIRAEDAAQCVRLAHYCKGACANVGANRVGGLMRRIEIEASAGQFRECGEALGSMEEEIELLRAERL
jgi:HPt (histidine-containing phosphotransfer) domain-containing protein